MPRRLLAFLGVAMALQLALLPLGRRIAPADRTAFGAGASGLRLVTDLAGRRVAIPRRVRRVACMDVLAYQTLFMLGASDRAALIYLTDAPWAAVTNPAYVRLPKTNGPPGREEVLARRVDLILTSYNPQRTTREFAAIGVPCVVTDHRTPRAPTRRQVVGGIKRYVLLLGRVMGPAALARAREWCSYFDARIRFITARTDALPPSRRPRVYYTFGPSPLNTTLGRDNCVYWLGEMAGADMVLPNTVSDPKGPVSMETVMKWDPQVVLIGRPYPVSIVLSDSRWRNVSAVRTGRVYALPNGVFYWDGGLEGVLFMEYLAKLLHPDLFPDLDMAAEFKFFYSKFYHYKLSDEQVRLLLAGLGPDGRRRPPHEF